MRGCLQIYKIMFYPAASTGNSTLQCQHPEYRYLTSSITDTSGWRLQSNTILFLGHHCLNHTPSSPHEVDQPGVHCSAVSISTPTPNSVAPALDVTDLSQVEPRASLSMASRGGRGLVPLPKQSSVNWFSTKTKPKWNFWEWLQYQNKTKMVFWRIGWVPKQKQNGFSPARATAQAILLVWLLVLRSITGKMDPKYIIASELETF